MTDPTTADSGSTGIPPAAGKTSVWEDFIDIFHSPSSVFARRENGNFWIPLLIITVVLGALNFANSGVLAPMRDAAIQKQTAQMKAANPQITDEQIATGRKIGEVIAQVGAFVFVPIAIFVIGLVTWVVGKMFEATESLQNAIVIATYALAPRILESVLAGLQGLLLSSDSLTSPYSISLSPARFLNADSTSPFLMAILGHIDLFTIWLVALLAIGLSVMGKIPRSRAAMAGAALWILGLVPSLLTAARS